MPGVAGGACANADRLCGSIPRRRRRTTRIDYRAAFISFKFVRASSLDEIARWFNAEVDRDEAANVPEHIAGRRLSETVRSRGTVQASTWTFTTPSRSTRDRSWFVVVTRNDPAWGANLSLEREPYALAVVLDDRRDQLQLHATNLYTQIEARLRARARVRARR